jgi:hypothetical protein
MNKTTILAQEESVDDLERKFNIEFGSNLREDVPFP